MKRLIKYTGIITLLQCFVACQHKELYQDEPQGDVPVDVIIHWDSVPSHTLELPRNMTVHWYPSLNGLISTDMSPRGGKEWLNADEYDVMCMDFNGPTTLSFRSNGTRQSFEVYNNLQTGTYNLLVPQLPDGETTVAEAYPYQFYIDSRSQAINTKTVLVDSTHTVHFYPKNVLREFTFMIYDVKGAENMIKNGGAITGMSGSYFPATGELASTPSTILFSRVEGIKNAQAHSRWTDREKAIFAAKNPDWASTDTLRGWTRDWVTGKFVTFGPLDTGGNRFRLTVESSNQANSRVYAAWGYWHGQWENTIAEQIAGAMGRNGTQEEQLAWRERNGGYDIILYNDHRLVVPKGETTGGEEGGFTVGVGDWGDPIDVPVGGSSSRAARETATSRTVIYTEETVPDFVVNGVHTADGESSLMFNAQYVYKSESGIWSYQPMKYWPRSGEVDFYAYAPAGLKNLTNGLKDDNTDTPVIEYKMPYKQRNNDDEPPPGTGEDVQGIPLVVDDNQEDLLVAVLKRDLQSDTATDPVPLNFRHAFSRVGVSAKFAGDANSYRIKVVRMDLRNVYTKGKLRLNQNDILDVSSEATLWYEPDSLANYRFKLITAAVPVSDEYTALVSSNDRILVMPQEITESNDARIYIEYEVYTYTNGTERFKEMKSEEFPLATGFKFAIGRQYNLTLTLD